LARARRERASERQMPRAISRKGFLRLGGVGLAGAALLGAADCSGSLSCNKVVKFQTIAEETSMQERAALEIQVGRFEDQHPKYALEREVTLADEASTVSNTNKEMQTTLQSEDPPDVFSYDTGPGFGGVLAEAGLLRPLEVCGALGEETPVWKTAGTSPPISLPINKHP
jgi:ABC-type glycerol-3-phosphate transport system substrate-binding protein